MEEDALTNLSAPADGNPLSKGFNHFVEVGGQPLLPEADLHVLTWWSDWLVGQGAAPFTTAG